MVKSADERNYVDIVEYSEGMEDGFMDVAGVPVAYIRTSIRNPVKAEIGVGDYIATYHDGRRQCLYADASESKYMKGVIYSYTSHIKLNQMKIDELNELNAKLNIARSQFIDECGKVE